MGIINEMEAWQKELTWHDKQKQEISDYLDAFLAEKGKVIYDTFIMDCAERFLLTPYLAKRIIDKCLSEREYIGFDGVKITANKMHLCGCGARYSEVLNACPNCKR